MKTSIEKVGKLAAKTKRAGERNMVGPTMVPLEVLDSILKLDAGQKAILELIETIQEGIEIRFEGAKAVLRGVEALEEGGRLRDKSLADLLERVEGITTIIGVVKEREGPPFGLAARVEVIEGNIREALAEIVRPDEEDADENSD